MVRQEEDDDGHCAAGAGIDLTGEICSNSPAPRRSHVIIRHATQVKSRALERKALHSSPHSVKAEDVVEAQGKESAASDADAAEVDGS